VVVQGGGAQVGLQAPEEGEPRLALAFVPRAPRMPTGRGGDVNATPP